MSTAPTGAFGNRTGWTADRLVCLPARQQWPQNPGPNPGWPPNNQAQIAVPVPAPQPNVQALNCTYYPAVWGYQTMSVNAFRTRY